MPIRIKSMETSEAVCLDEKDRYLLTWHPPLSKLIIRAYVGKDEVELQQDYNLTKLL